MRYKDSKGLWARIPKPLLMTELSLKASNERLLKICRNLGTSYRAILDGISTHCKKLCIVKRFRCGDNGDKLILKVRFNSGMSRLNIRVNTEQHICRTKFPCIVGPEGAEWNLLPLPSRYQCSCWDILWNFWLPGCPYMQMFRPHPIFSCATPLGSGNRLLRQWVLHCEAASYLDSQGISEGGTWYHCEGDSSRSAGKICYPRMLFSSQHAGLL